MEDKDLLKKVFPVEEAFRIARAALNYSDDFEKIANHPIYEKLTVRGVKLSHKTIKRAYKEMESIKFRGDIFDYLCYTSLHYTLVPSITSVIVSDSNTKSALKMMRYFFDHLPVPTVLACRLILKDETYLDEVFHHFDVEKGKFYDGVKKFVYQKMNEFLKVEPGIDRIHLINVPPASAFPETKPKQLNKSNKLNRS